MIRLIAHLFLRMPSSSSTVVRRPWLLTLLGLIAATMLVAMPLAAAGSAPSAMPDLVRFLGRFHPLLLHLPIGVFAWIVVQELVAIFRGRRDEPTPLGPFLFGAASAVVAATAGFLLYLGEDYGGGDLIERHLWGGIAFAIAAIATTLVKAWNVALGRGAFADRALLVVAMGVMTVASHDGASITHGSDYLTRHAPAPLRALMGLQEDEESVGVARSAVDPVVYAAIIAPVFEKRCVQCHKEGKAKGDLRMDRFDLLMAGGKEGPALVAGDAAGSRIIQRIELPEDDEEHMPPEGKPDIEAHELTLLKWWIDQGAEETKTLSAMTLTDEVRAALAKWGPLSPTASPQPSSSSLSPVPPDAALVDIVRQLQERFPAAVSFESAGSSAVVFSAASLRKRFDDASLERLVPLMPHLVSLDLTATSVTDRGLAVLASAKQLRQLKLGETTIGDEVLPMLSALPSLQSLNLYRTRVTSAGIDSLQHCAALSHLYLWDTTVDADALERLRQFLPNCRIQAPAAP
jgi:hypothetical protein